MHKLLGLFGRARQKDTAPTHLDKAISAASPAIWGMVAFSSVTTILSVVPAIYMLNVFDRVLSSRNMTTLIMLTAIALFLILISAIIDRLRSQVALRMGAWCDKLVSPPLLVAAQDVALRAGRRVESQLLRDLDSFREFWTGPGIHTLVRVAWSPLFVVIMFLLQPLLGFISLAGVIIIGFLTFANERATRQALQNASTAGQRASTTMAAGIRNVEVMHAMGMRPAFRSLWGGFHEAALKWQNMASDQAAIYSVLSSFVSTVLGIAILAVGIYLAVIGEISVGAVFAARIISGLATGPLIELIKQWKSYVSASICYHNLQNAFTHAEDNSERLLLPPPEGALSAHDVVLELPETRQVILRSVNFSIEPGETVAIVGPSGSGKSTLVRAIVGVLQPVMGEIRLAGADLRHWQVDQLGKHLGYVPQEVELLPGTIAQNIARFNERNDEAVVEAAQLVGAHDLIQRLPNGYNTQIDLEGRGLSGGQRQRIALARAVYGEPALIVLDEPNSNLDAAGEQALLRAIREFKRLGITVLIVTHKAQILAMVDKIIYINGGVVSHFGKRDEVMARISQKKVVSIPGSTATGNN